MLSKLFSRKPKHQMGSPEANQAVRTQIARLGDDGSSSRHVLHYAYPEPGQDIDNRARMIEELKARGFAVKAAVTDNGLVLEHNHCVTADQFDALTTELREWFAERGWDYDGWECAVVR